MVRNKFCDQDKGVINNKFTYSSANHRFFLQAQVNLRSRAEQTTTRRSPSPAARARDKNPAVEVPAGLQRQKRLAWRNAPVSG
jgi:hypothetical protein